MNKRERVLTALQLGEPDIIPIHCPGFEISGTAYQIFKKSNEYNKNKKIIHSIGDITEWRFWNSDLQVMDPFKKISSKIYPPPPEYEGYKLNWNGSLKKRIIRSKTNQPYWWYIKGLFSEKEILMNYWDKFGSPSTRFNEEEDYSAIKWEKFCEKLHDFFLPMVKLSANIWESVFEGIGLGRVSYYMRKDPNFIDFVMGDFCKLNLKIIKGLGEAGVEICIMYDDLGQKNRTLLSLKSFRRFVLPHYKKMYKMARKYGILFIQHSCGNITDFLPDLINAGLSGIQSLEPTSKMDLTYIKEKFGDKIALLGGINSSSNLKFGNMSQIQNDIKNCARILGNNGGYFLGPAHNIIDIPWKNVLLLKNTMIKSKCL